MSDKNIGEHLIGSDDKIIGVICEDQEGSEYGVYCGLVDRVIKERAELQENLDFAFKRSMVLANILKIPVVRSRDVTGTILGLVRRNVERLQSKNAELQSQVEQLKGQLAAAEDLLTAKPPF